MKTYLNKYFKSKKFVVGMIHLPPLIGNEGYLGLQKTLEHALVDLHRLQQGGVNAVMVENEYDHPHQVTVGPEIVSMMTKIVEEVVKNSSIPVGVEVLLNDPKASLAIAKISGAKYIRTDYFVDKMARSEYGGEMQIDPKGLLDYRNKIDAKHVAIMTDIQVKYAQLLEMDKPIELSAMQAIEAGSDSIVVSGKKGGVPLVSELNKVMRVAGGVVPIVVGSGVSLKNAKKLLMIADGVIIGRRFKDKNGYMDINKIKKLMSICQ